MTDETAAKESLLRRQLQEQAEARAKMVDQAIQRAEEWLREYRGYRTLIGPTRVIDDLLAALRAPNPGWVSVPKLPFGESPLKQSAWDAFYATVGHEIPKNPDGTHSGTFWVALMTGIQAYIAAAPHSPQTNPAQQDSSDSRMVHSLPKGGVPPAAAGPDVREAALSACLLIASTGGTAMHCVEAIRALPLGEGK